MATLPSLSDRNNNPLNIRTSNDTWVGAKGSNAGFVKFSNPEYGVRAAAKNLYTSQEKHGNNSIADIITRWAPPGPPDYNKTDAYIAKVASDLGVDANADLGSLKDNPELTAKLIKSMAHQEGATVGADGKYTDAILKTGVNLANGSPLSENQLAGQETDFNPGMFEGPRNEYAKQSTDTASAKGTNKNKIANTSDSVITPNWMSTVDSPSYKWTLYIVSNEVWNDTSILYGNDTAALTADKAKIVAEQGVTTEFTLDNFAMASRVTPGQAHGNTTPGIIQFDLFETLGFTFLDKVLRAGVKLNKPQNLYSQNYVLKLEFIGRDATTGGSTKYPGVFFYPIRISQIRSTTSPGGTRYNIVAMNFIKVALTEAVTHTNINVNNFNTVDTFASQLQAGLNAAELNKLSEREITSGGVQAKTFQIVFNQSTKTKARYTKLVKDFTLDSQPWVGVVDATTAAGHATSLTNVDMAQLTVKSETALPSYIKDAIQKNCPTWSKFVTEMNALERTPYIVVTPEMSYAKIGQKATSIVRGTLTEEDGTAFEPIIIKLTIAIGYSGTVPAEGSHVTNFTDTNFQNEKFKNMPIEKLYTYLYSGTNIEVINYQLDLEALFVTARTPMDGFYHADAMQQFSGSIIDTTTKNPRPAEDTSVYLEDTKYNVDALYNDLVNYEKRELSIEEQAGKSTTDTSNSLIANILSESARREQDAMSLSIEIKGDPYWMGNKKNVAVDGTVSLPDWETQDALIAFLQYNPNVNDLLELQIKGPVDLVSSGIYKIISIDSRFQGGAFTQTLNGMKDITTNTLLTLPQLIKLEYGG